MSDYLKLINILHKTKQHTAATAITKILKEREELKGQVKQLESQVKCMSELCLTTGEVNEIKAIAGRAGFIYGLELATGLKIEDDIVMYDIADEYTDKIRSGEL